MADNNLSKAVINTVNSVVADLEKAGADITPLMTSFAETVYNSIQKNRDSGGRWDGNENEITVFSGGSHKWKDLAESTKKQYRKKGWSLVPTLRREGFLEQSISITPNKTSLSITANADYARIHQLGGDNMPPRPYILLQEEDLQEFYDTIEDYVHSLL